MPSRNPVFVKVDEPLDLRRALIESAMSSVTLLKEHERLKVAEKAMDELTSRFNAALRNIERHISSLSALMPRLNDQNLKTSEEIPSQVEQSDTQMEIGISEQVNMEDELNDIERKLQDITF